MKLSKERFFNIVDRIVPEKHIHGIEENVRAKIVVPLFEALGYDLLEDLHLEYSGVDLLVRGIGENSLIVEVKTLIKRFSARQVLTYCYNLGCPWICVVAQDGLRLYHAFGLFAPLRDSSALFSARIEELAQVNVFDRLSDLVGKSALFREATALRSCAVHELGVTPQELDSWWQELKARAPELLEVTSTTLEMWRKLEELAPDIYSRIDQLASGRKDIEKGEPPDPFILRALSEGARHLLIEFGKTIEAETGGRGACFYRRMNCNGTLTMEVASNAKDE